MSLELRAGTGSSESHSAQLKEDFLALLLNLERVSPLLYWDAEKASQILTLNIRLLSTILQYKEKSWPNSMTWRSKEYWIWRQETRFKTPFEPELLYV